MDEKGFREFCHTSKRVLKGLSDEKIAENIKFVKEFEKFLAKRKKDLRKATGKDLADFSELMVKNDTNKFDNYVALIRYARFINNKEVEIAVLSFADGAQVLGELGKTIQKTEGKAKHDAVFRGLNMPVMGSSHEGWPEITRMFMERLQETLGTKGARDALRSGPHAPPREAFAEDRQKYLKAGSLDEFLKIRHSDAVKTLKTHMKEDTLFYDQAIDEDALDFVRVNQEVMGGVRKGGVIYETKIPYRLIQYLHEKDERKKRYFACHCPWVRESILSGPKVSPEFCYCSAGYHKRPWDVIFDEPVEIDVLESVLQGDPVCRFAIHVPEKALPPRKKKAKAKKRRETGK
ncbi:MAG: hypothetical protein MUC90_04455 [Thermoplasmata archaeon]|jgi:hypothetical protein|nr:hypothetical protein [Thermoplasmata archaeon]